MTDSDFARYGKKLVQYFWDPLPRNTDLSATPIYCLGVPYENQIPPPAPAPAPAAAAEPASPSAPSPSDSAASRSFEVISEPEEITKSEVICDGSQDSSQNRLVEDDGGWPPAFLDDFESKIRLSYRSNFPPIPRSQDPKAAAAMSLAVRIRQLGQQEGFTSDTGWGCMIRTGQSLLANALLFSELGRDWRRGQKGLEERKLLSLFADDARAPFSIHRFVHHGASACGKHPGEWFGPSATARCIQALVKEKLGDRLAVYITGDGSDVFEDAVFQTAKARTGSFQPTLILIGTRLGLDRITPVYWEALKASLQMPQSMGIAGGRPSSSLYFVGTQGSDIFYLDPHQTRPALPLHRDAHEYTEDEVETCHTRRLRRLHLREMDPSMLMGFLIRDGADWQSWRQGISSVSGKTIIHVADRQVLHHRLSMEREAAIDEVGAFDTEEEP